MHSRLTLAIAVVCLLLLSGCSVISWDGNHVEFETEPPVWSFEETDQTPTSDGPATAKLVGDDIMAAPGTGEAGGDAIFFDAEEVHSDHVDAIESAGSYTTQASTIIHNGSVTRYSNETHVIERDGPVLVVVNTTIVTPDDVTDHPVTVRFTEGVTTYEQQVTWANNETEIEYRKGSHPYTATEPKPVDRTAAAKLDNRALMVIDTATWQRTDTGEIEGVEATQYDASIPTLDVGGFEDIDATLILDDNGVVRYVSYHFVLDADGERTEYRHEAAYLAVGNTSLERPGWVDRIRNE